MNNIKLLFEKELFVNGIGTLYKPTIKEIGEIGEDTFNKYNLPFLMSRLDYLNLPDEYKEQFHNFDVMLFCDENGKKILRHKEQDMIDILVESLKFYFRTDDVVKYEEQGLVVINKENPLYYDNFDDLAEIILRVNRMKTPKFEKIAKESSDEAKEIFEFMQKQRQDVKDKEHELTLDEIVLIVRHGGSSIISYDEIYDMTITKFMSDYLTICGKESFEKNFSQALVSTQDGIKKLDLTHWISKIENINKI